MVFMASSLVVRGGVTATRLLVRYHTVKP